jgi:hypothetical protein
MADQNTDAENKLKKLGERVREGWVKEHPTTEQQLESIRGTIREEWEKERETKIQPSAEQDLTKDKEKEGPEPDLER